MSTAECLKILDSRFGISGDEHSVSAAVKELLRKYVTSIETDSIGNVIGVRKGTNPSAPSVMIEAHMDELGLMVSRITDEGSLNFITVGGFDSKVLPATEVTVHAKEELFGVIGVKPPHISGNKNREIKISDLCIDIGLSKEEAEKIVSVGDFVTINTSYTKLGDEFVAARCIDDRGGIAAVIGALEILKDAQIENDIIAVATVQEELGLRGARVAAAHIKPDCAIAIDVCHGTSPNVSDDAFPCSKGPVISIGPNLHTKFTQQLINAAKRSGTDMQIEVCSGDTGTDAWEIQTAACGIPTALISVPVRYMHANYEVASIKDIESASKIIAETIRMLKGGECLCY